MARPSSSRGRPASSHGTASSPTVLSASADMRWFGYKDIATLCARTMEERFPLPSDSREDDIEDSRSDTLIELSSSGCHVNDDGEDAGTQFAEWVAYVLYRTVLPMHTVFHALHLILRLSTSVSEGNALPESLDPPPPQQPDGKASPPNKNQLHYRLFLSALILCTTYSMDDAYANKSWAIAAKFIFDIKSINRMEFDLFRALDWQLAAEGERVHEIVRAYETEWQAGLKQQARLRAAREQERRREREQERRRERDQERTRSQDRKRHQREGLRRLESYDSSSYETAASQTPKPNPSTLSGRTSAPNSVPPSPASKESSARPFVPPSPASRESVRPPSRSRQGSYPEPPPRTASRQSSYPDPSSARERTSSMSRQTSRPETSASVRESARPESRASSARRQRSLSAGIKEAALSLFRPPTRDLSRDRGDGLPKRGLFRVPSRRSTSQERPRLFRTTSREPSQERKQERQRGPRPEGPRRSSEDKGKGREAPEPAARERTASGEARWLGFQIGSIARGARPLPRPPAQTAKSSDSTATLAATKGPALTRTTTAPPESTVAAAPPQEEAPQPAEPARTAAPWGKTKTKSRPPVALRRMTSQPCIQTARMNFPVTAAG